MLRTTITSLLLALAACLSAQDNLKMHLDFENVSGRNITDPVSGVTVQASGVASVVQIGKYHALDLGNNRGYLIMGKSTGEIVQSLNDYTVAACYRVASDASLSGNGFFLWTFSTTATGTATEGQYTAYRLNAQRVATSTGGYNNESGMQVGSTSPKGRWVSVVYRQSGTTGELFVDGKLVGENASMPILSKVFTQTPTCCYVGRSPFADDNFLRNTLVADFRIYGEAVGDAEVQSLAALATDIDKEYRYGTPGDPTALQALVAEAKAWMAAATGNYAPNAVSEVQDAVDIADTELATGKASQLLLDERLLALQTAFDKAKATEGYASKRVFEATDNHGFIHPGGIVSQQDIDRAKKLLAEGDATITKAWEILCANEYSSADTQTWPVETIVRGGGSGQNYMNVARGAAMAYQNALRWKIGGTTANADAAVRILMAWAKGNKYVSGDTNLSLAAGIYGYELANAAELMRDYEGWSSEDFETFRRYMIRVWYNPAIDFLRRRHDTWLNARYSNLGERPGHYWSNWGLCNALCVMSIGILCDDVHMYNQGVSFYKYDHVGTYKDRTNNKVILNDGCDEFIGNLVPVVLPDERGPLGYLGQMQESGRDQGHALMALGLALDICTVGLNQGDDLFAYMNDRIAAGTEFVAAMNFGGVDATSLPWINYNYADCRGTMGSGWQMTGPNTGGSGEYRPYWDRAIGYYEGMRGVKLQYADKAHAKICPDGGGGNYSQNSGGFDHIGFSTLTSWRPAIAADSAITPLSGDIIYKGETYANQTNLGGLKYNYEAGATKAIPADSADITLVPQLPEGTEDTGKWLWSTGETTRSITVKADRSYIYRVSYTAANGKVSHQAFAIAVCGDGKADLMTEKMAVDGVEAATTEKTVLQGSSVSLSASATTGWTNDYLWDNGSTSSSVTIPAIVASRQYRCQYANQSGAVSESVFSINVVEAQQTINGAETDSVCVLAGSDCTLRLAIPSYANPDDITWQDGSHGTSFELKDVEQSTVATATYHGVDYTYTVNVRASDFSYYNILTTDKGYSIISSVDELKKLSASSYFVLASDEADLLVALRDAPKNGNKALLFSTPAEPMTDLSTVFTIETYGDAFCLRNVDYDALLLQTEWDRPDQMRTHDQPLACEWSRLLFEYNGDSWTVENGKYTGNWLGLWTPDNGYKAGEELACNKTGDDICHLQLFAVNRSRFHNDYTLRSDAPVDITPLLVNPSFVAANGYGWTLTGSWGNQRYNGAAEVWHSTNFDISQTISGLPEGRYTVTCQMANGDGSNTGYLYATTGSTTNKDVVGQSCSGSDFATERDKMASDSAYGKLSVDVAVNDGVLTIGVAEPSAGTTWLVFDNFTLTYSSPDASGITEVKPQHDGSCADNVIYDLQGRRLTSVPQRGLYICKGKKYIVK